MKRYLLFGYDQYYPSGGWTDYKGSFDSIEECKEMIESRNLGYMSKCDYWDIVDRDTEEVICT